MARYTYSALVLMATAAIAAPALELRDLELEVRADNSTNGTLDCTPGSTAGIQPGCWTQLDIPTYIENWVAANGTAANCGTLGFAQCYLQFNGYSGLTCDLITSNTCPPFDTKTEDYSSSEQFYVLWNIYAIYQFFNQYSLALTSGSSLAGQTIDKIVATVAPKVESVAKTSSLLSVITGSLGVTSFITGLVPGGTAPALIMKGISAMFSADKAFSDTLASASTQTSNERFLQLADIGENVATLVEEYQNNLLTVIKSVQGNATIFAATGTDGAFSQRITTSQTSQSTEIFKQLRLYVLSQALKANGIIAARSTGISALEVARDTGAITCDQTGEYGNCYQWWIDTEKKNTYALHNPKDWRNTQIDLTNNIVLNGWANLSDIFKVEDCAGKDVTFDTNTITPTCIVSHNWCEWNYTAPAAFDSWGHNGQWTNCASDEEWGTLCSSWTSSINVPESYLGPLLKTDGAYCKN